MIKETIKHYCFSLKSFNVVIEKILELWTIRLYSSKIIFSNIEGISFCPYCGEKLK